MLLSSYVASITKLDAVYVHAEIHGSDIFYVVRPVTPSGGPVPDGDFWIFAGNGDYWGVGSGDDYALDLYFRDNLV